MYIDTYIHMYTYTYIHAYIYKCTYNYIHLYTHTHGPISTWKIANVATGSVEASKAPNTMQLSSESSYTHPCWPSQNIPVCVCVCVCVCLCVCVCVWVCVGVCV